MKAVLLSVLMLVSFGITSDPVGITRGPRTAGPLKLRDLTLDKAVRFQVSGPMSVVLPANTAVVITQAHGGTITINGLQRANAAGFARIFDPPIVAHAGDTVDLAGGGSLFTIAGFVVPESDVAISQPSSPVPLILLDMTLDRAHRFLVSDPNASWTVTVPTGPTVSSLAVVDWYQYGGSSAFPLTFTVDGIVVATTNSAGGQLTQFNPPIIVHPGQTFAATWLGANSLAGDIGGYLVYPGET